jgi:SAM-dependent methyltransferase
MNATLAVGAMPDSGLGTLPFDEVTTLLREVEGGVAWQKAVTTLPLRTLSGKRHWFTNPKKASFYLSLTTPTQGVAIDIGAGSGVIASELARRFERVIAVEQDEKWARFMTHRFRQDGLAVDVLQGSAFRLPPTVTNADLAVVNGVLEWVAFGDSPEAKAGTPRDVQIAFLNTLRSALRPGGRIGIAIENRFHFEYFRGASPHGELPYVAVMPRPLADAVTRRRQGAPYRTWIYGARGYARLLRDAGFVRPQIFAALPSYHRPELFVPLERTDAIRPYLIEGSRLRRVALTAIAAAGLLGQMVHSFYIAADRPEH